MDRNRVDDNVLGYWRLPNGNYIVKLEKDDRLDGDNDMINTLPSHLGAFKLSNSKRNTSFLSDKETDFIIITHITQTPIH